MQKIGDITDTADSNGEFTDGKVAGNVQPTELMAAWFTTLQRELIAVLTAAGITPNKADDAQVAKAIKSLIDAGIGGSGYLISKNNLSDLEDAAESRGHLGLGQLATKDSLGAADVGLDKVGNFMAVQQNGGDGMLSNKVYIGWTGSAVKIQVDESDMGLIYTTGNPPDLSGYIHGDACNQAGFIAQNADAPYLMFSGGIVVGLARDAWVSQNFVTAVRLGSERVQASTNDSGGVISLGGGELFTGAAGVGGSDFNKAQWRVRQLQYCINGQWISAGSI